MITGNDGFYQVMKILLDEAKTALIAAGQPALNRVCVVSGDIAWDECECGQLVGNVGPWFYSDSFPNDVVFADRDRPSPCAAAFIVANMKINIARCAATVPDTGVAPTCAALDANAKRDIIDAAVIRNTVGCKLETMKDNDDIENFRVVGQTTVGPAGQCVGSELNFMVALDR